MSPQTLASTPANTPSIKASVEPRAVISDNTDIGLIAGAAASGLLVLIFCSGCCYIILSGAGRRKEKVSPLVANGYVILF